MRLELEANVFDVWVFRRSGSEIEYLLLYTSEQKAYRYFNGGRFWQIPSGTVEPSEKIADAIARRVGELALITTSIWAAEHTYTIYNRRFECMQLIGVYAAEVKSGCVRLDPTEHSEYRWCSYEQAQGLVHYRGLKDGLGSTLEYVTGPHTPAAELRLR